jgi:hypothetical protein
MESTYLDFINLGVAFTALISYFTYDVTKSGVKWYVNLTKAINLFLSERR